VFLFSVLICTNPSRGALIAVVWKAGPAAPTANKRPLTRVREVDRTVRASTPCGHHTRSGILSGVRMGRKALHG
jgi:hypothetical protein